MKNYNGYVKYTNKIITEINVDDLPNEPIWKNQDFTEAIGNDPSGTFYGDLDCWNWSWVDNK
jgi:hypothetical protein